MGMVVEKTEGDMPALEGWLYKKHKGSSFGNAHSKRFLKCNDEKGARGRRAPRRPVPHRAHAELLTARACGVLAQAG